MVLGQYHKEWNQMQVQIAIYKQPNVIKVQRNTIKSDVLLLSLIMQLFLLAGLFHGNNSSFGSGELEVACVISAVLRCFMVDVGGTG